MRTPKLRRHAHSGRYVVTVRGKDIYLGRDQAEAEILYHRMMQDYVASGGQRALPTAPEELLICEIIERYIIDREEHYYVKRPQAFARGKKAMRHLNRGFGHYKATQFDMTALRRLRQSFLEPTERGRLLVRREVNKLMAEITRFWRWAASHELAPAEIYAKCQTLEPLKRGHCTAPESEPVRPVPMEHVEEVKALVNRSVAALIDLQLYTGARPGELTGLRACDLDRSGAVWHVVLREHKSAHRGRLRTLYFGERAQAVLRPFLLARRPDEFLFSPQDYLLEKTLAAETHRRADQISNPKKSQREVGDKYDVNAYRRAITRACEQAGIPRWHPHQLRHTAATELRKQYGVEVARAVLGHAHVAATEIYAEVDAQVAQRVAQEQG